MMKKVAILFAFSLISLCSLAANTNKVVRAGWKNIDSAYHLSGKELTPEALNDKVVIVQRWCISCENIEKGAAEFQSLAKRYQDYGFIFLVSYCPDEDHDPKAVERFLKKQNVVTPVYIGAQAMGVKGSGAHRTMYVVKDGAALWQVKKDNTDIKPLMKFIEANKLAWVEEEIKTAAEKDPASAIELGKKLKKANMKLSPETKKLLDGLKK